MTEQEIEQGVAALPDWNRVGNKIQRNLEFESFLDAVAFINRIAPLADAADHHPELFNVYNRVELVLTTHDAGGLTHRDFALAAQIDSVVSG